MVAEKDHGKSFTATFWAGVNLRTGPYIVLPDNSILNTANMQSETGFPSSHQLKSYITSKSRQKLAARAVLSADAGLLVLAQLVTFTLTSEHVSMSTGQKC